MHTEFVCLLPNQNATNFSYVCKNLKVYIKIKYSK